jgi:hypothetical protein
MKIIKNCLVLIIILDIYSFAQTNSFYSQIGVGIPQYSFSARRLGMGELGAAVDDKDFISVLNPASWNAIELTRIEFGVSFNGLFVKSSDDNKFFTNNYFSGFAVAFPVSRDNGISLVLGLVPITRVLYETEFNVNDPSISYGNYTTDITGSGGISKMFIGSSYKLPFDLSVGASLDYYFGNITYNSQVTFNDSNNVSSTFSLLNKINGIGGTFGMISPDLNNIFNITGVKNIKLGLSLNLASNLNVDTNFTKRTTEFEDTISHGNTNIKLPLRIVGGMSFMVGNSYLFSLDYLYQPWKDYRYSGLPNPSLRDSRKFSVGMEYRPNPSGHDFKDLMIWRFGLGYESTPYQINGVNINQFSVSGGVSLPFDVGNTVDLGIQYTSRGTTQNNLVEENVVQFDVGISFGELWFVRPDR